MDRFADVSRELERVVDRLNSMPLTRAVTATDDVRATAAVLVDETRLLGSGAPPEATLPELGPSGLGAMIAVLGNDWLTAARMADRADPSAVEAALVSLRRALP